MDKESITLARELRHRSCRLAYLEDEGEYSSIDRFREVTNWISRTCHQLTAYRGSTPEEEAEICLSILMGYSTAIHEVKTLQKVLNRSRAVLPKLSPSLLKCQLLVYCYAEVYDETLADEARTIIRSWGNKKLTVEEKRTKELLEEVEKYG